MGALQGRGVLHYELFPYLYGLLRSGAAGAAPARVRVPGRPARRGGASCELLVGPDLLAAPVTGGGHDAERLPARPATGSTSTPATTRDRRRGLHPRRRRSRSSRSTSATGAVVPFNLRTRRLVVGRRRADASGPRRLARDERRRPRPARPAARRPDLRSGPAPAAARTLAGDEVPWTWNAGPLPGVVVRVHGPTVRGGSCSLAPRMRPCEQRARQPEPPPSVEDMRCGAAVPAHAQPAEDVRAARASASPRSS